MNTIAYIEAWNLWLAGEATSTYYLWGLKILWWGRLGKVASLLAGLVVISEIIGSGNLLRWSNDLQTAIDIRITINVLVRQWYETLSDIKSRKIVSSFYGRLVSWLVNNVFRATKSRVLKISAFGVLVITFISILFITDIGSYLLLLILVDFLVNLLWKFIAPILVFLFRFVIAVLVFLANGIIQPFASLLAWFANDRNAKAFSVAILIIGFHFDLLAS